MEFLALALGPQPHSMVQYHKPIGLLLDKFNDFYKASFGLLYLMKCFNFYEDSDKNLMFLNSDHSVFVMYLR